MWEYGKKKGALYKEYPCILAEQGLIDITGYVTAQAYYNKVVWGLEEKPYICVRPVNHSGERPSKSVWRGTDAIVSWSWPAVKARMHSLKCIPMRTRWNYVSTQVAREKESPEDECAVQDEIYPRHSGSDCV